MAVTVFLSRLSPKNFLPKLEAQGIVSFLVVLFACRDWLVHGAGANAKEFLSAFNTWASTGEVYNYKKKRLEFVLF